MKTQLSSLDIYFLAKELSARLTGARVDKVYQTGERELLIALRAGKAGAVGEESSAAGAGSAAEESENESEKKAPNQPGKLDLVIDPNYLCITKFEKEVPKKPGAFAMLLRKAANGGVVSSVAQHRFDRIVEMRLEGRGRFIFEFFSRGNVIFADEEGVIVAVLEGQEWKDRTLKVGIPYKYPPETADVPAMSQSDFSVAMAEKREIVKILASRVGLGGTYANELITRAGIRPEEFADRARSENAYAELRRMLESQTKASIVSRERPEDVVPFEMVSYQSLRKDYKDSFNEAVDEYFTRVRAEEDQGEATSDYEDEIGSLEGRLERQKGALGAMDSEYLESKAIGDAIYARFSEVRGILDGIKRAKKEGKNWVAFLQESGVEVPNPGDREFEMDLGVGKKVGISIDKSVQDNASYYYDKSKKARGKLEGTQGAIKKSERDLAELRRRKKIAEKRASEQGPVEKKKTEWYEKFRWFYSSDGYLVIGGKDAESNELLVKHHVEPNDIVFHADVRGAPFFVVKNARGGKLPESTKKETAEAAACYSSGWNDGFGSVDVYAVRPDQVTKTAQSGEYLTKGAFVIRGEREWFKGIALKMAVGFKTEDSGLVTVIGGPIDAVKSRSKYIMKIGVGDMKSGELAREIKAGILRKTDKEDGQRIKKANLSDIQKWIPAGKGMIVK